MNTERHRERADRSSTRSLKPDPAPNGSDADGADGAAETASAGNGHTESNGHNGNGNTHSSSGGGLARTTLTLPRRKRPASETRNTEMAESVAVAPDERVVIAPAPARKPAPPPAPAPKLPPKAKRGAASASVVATTPVVPAPLETVEATSGPRFWRPQFTLASLLWVSFLVIAVVTRFWDIGNRGIHHDESLHSVYSNNLYTGGGYVHDPMMHGPLQFHLIAFMFWLFGATDATARFASALCGVWVVISPFFLRKQMGRVSALLASFLLLVSPSVLYFSRMAREDSIFSATEMLMIVGLWRFISTRRPGDFYIFCAGLSLMFTIKETSYLTTAVLIGFFALLFVLQAGYAIMGALGAYAVAMGGLLVYVNGQMKAGAILPLPNIPETGPNYDKIAGFVQALIAHPLVWGSAVLTLLFLASVLVLFNMQKRRMLAAQAGVPSRVSRNVPAEDTDVEAMPVEAASPNGYVVAVAEAPPVVASTVPAEEEPEWTAVANDDASQVWNPRRLDPRPGTFLARYQPGSLPYLAGSLFSRPSVLLIGFLIAAGIFTTLYTVFFTDVPRGIASGLFASIGYWMAQQGVARGGQPWYYYFLILPLYEPIAVFFSLAGTIFFSWKGIRWFMRRKSWARTLENPPRLGAFNTNRPVPFARFSAFMPLFLIWWILGAVFLYSWAGEKMPWLMVHMVRPAALLAALFLGTLVMSLVRRRQERLDWASLPEEYDEEPVAARPEGVVAGNGRAANGSRAVQPNRARRSTARPAPVVVARQAPPWVVWNRPGSHFPALAFVTMFTLFALAWGMTMNTRISETAAKNTAYAGWWATWLWPGLMLALVVAFAVWVGPGRALRYLAVGIFSVMFLYQFRSATVLAYQEPDVSKEMASYVQTSPDVTRVMQEMDEFSKYQTGGKNIKVLYDSFASWPFSWYLRDYKNSQFIAAAQPDPAAGAPVMLMEYGSKNNNTALDKDYVKQRYAMRWWFPEEWYKNDLVSSLPPGQDYKSAPFLSSLGAVLKTGVSTVTDPSNQATLWKYLLFRETPHPLGSEDMLLYLRKDIAQQWHYLQYNPIPSDNIVNQDYPPREVPVPTEYKYIP